MSSAFKFVVCNEKPEIPNGDVFARTRWQFEAIHVSIRYAATTDFLRCCAAPASHSDRRQPDPPREQQNWREGKTQLRLCHSLLRGPTRLWFRQRPRETVLDAADR